MPKKREARQRPSRIAGPRDLLAYATGSEINWTHAAPVLRNCIAGSFIYFIVEQEDGPVKIGVATDPIKRLRALQTGNPRQLKIERLIRGDATVEKALHAYFAEFVVGGKSLSSQFNPRYTKDTEWFRAEARASILEAASALATEQDLAPVEEPFLETVARVMERLGYEVRSGDVVRLLGTGSGYVEHRLRRPA